MTIKKDSWVTMEAGGPLMQVMSPVVEAVCCMWIDQNGVVHANYIPLKLLKDKSEMLEEK